jgi:predicted Zn finger-like uncharacterized protein
MIVQCEACQTRFRLADEKIKPGGTKVRCSKCKEVFTVTLPEPEPVEEAVDFGSFNMEAVSETTSNETASTSESPQADPQEFEEQPTPAAEPDSVPEQTEGRDLDFSSLESEMGNNAGTGEELADTFSFADTSQPVEEDSSEEESQEEPVEEQQTDFDAAFEETTGSAEPDEFGAAFEETQEPAESGGFDFSDDSGPDVETTEDAGTEDSTEPSDFSFDDDEEKAEEQDEPSEFSFGDEGDDTAFSFDDAEEETAPDTTEEAGAPGEFSFDEENPFDEEATSEWSDETSGDDTSFDFDEPQFDTDDTQEESPASSPEDGGLQFGEIDFAGDDEGEAPGFQTDDDFSSASMAQKEESEPFSPSPQSTPSPERGYDDDEPLPAPPPPKKSSLSRILVLLVLLLVILGGAAGFLFMQEGALNLNVVTKYLPFLQEYIGEAPASSPGDRIGINIEGSSYVNGQAGQMLIIQGAAVNNHPATRSAITVKGVLLDDKGQTLLQQTVFCGNKLEDSALETMPFAAIEEAMNNQFGDSLSNMNIAAGATIPFTIVFRNLPDGIANINVEVVDSKPGSG